MASIQTMMTDIFNKLDNDQLVQRIYDEGLGHEVFSNAFLSQLSTSHAYKTQEVAELCDVKGKEWVIRNNLNSHNLSDYVGLEKVGNRFVMDYISVVKMRMIIKLMQKNNQGPLFVAQFLGLVGSEIGSPHESTVKVKENSVLSIIQQYIQLMDYRQQLMYKRFSISTDLDRLKESVEQRANYLSREKELLDTHISIYQHLKSVENIHIDLEQQKKSTIDALEYVRNLFSIKRIFKKDKETIQTFYEKDLNQQIKENKASKEIGALKTKKDNLELEYKTYHYELNNKRQLLQKELSDIDEQLKQLDEKLNLIEKSQSSAIYQLDN
ncbi:hypothetical protein SAMN05421734_11326 [Pelagirhabdus alkalitolerans]|uniref:Uncharacterized protein n=1 Tax=Pelagirhabdus alkalitolerans TaxID=1612202 RepID=A0A1G6N0Y6_9BACI|nr:hypothetical protein [Pelagirhabdus alkalitolerans]SDC61134.1 hypothetical protein SAMN05421734_11326 [Pelagirhabdus alkalitolerans]